jgi:hypothetical protein
VPRCAKVSHVCGAQIRPPDAQKLAAGRLFGQLTNESRSFEVLTTSAYVEVARRSSILAVESVLVLFDTETNQSEICADQERPFDEFSVTTEFDNGVGFAHRGETIFVVAFTIELARSIKEARDVSARGFERT